MISYAPATQKSIVVPLWTVDAEEAMLRPAGSGVLLSYEDRKFLCTAAHVVNWGATHEIWVGGRYAFPIDRGFKRNQIPHDHTVKTDRIDFAAIELVPTEVDKLLDASRFLQLDLDTPYQRKDRRPLHQITGFLQDHNQMNERTLTANALRLEIVEEDKLIITDAFRARHRNWYVSGVYDERQPGWRVDQRFAGRKRFHGMSGGSWFYGSPYQTGVYLEFAGIVLEAQPHQRRPVTRFLGIGARAIIDMLHHWFPGLPPPQAPCNEPRLLSYLQR